MNDLRAQQKLQFQREDGLGVLWSRARENAGKLAMIYACWCESTLPVIDETAADWAMVERCRRATTGAWTYAVERGGCTIGGPVCYMDENNRMVVGTSGDWGPTADPECDAEFIAHARTDLPRLLVEVMRLRGLNPPDLDALRFGPHYAGDPQTEAQGASACVGA